MKSSVFAIAATVIAATLSPQSAFAAFWQDPVTETCEIGSGEECTVLAKCPGYQHAATIPAFEIATEPKTARVGLVSMVPVEATSWRVTWRNLGDDKVTVSASVFLRCGKNIKWGG